MLNDIASICENCFLLGRSCEGAEKHFTGCTRRQLKGICPYCKTELPLQLFPFNTVCGNCNAKYYSFDGTWMERKTIGE